MSKWLTIVYSAGITKRFRMEMNQEQTKSMHAGRSMTETLKFQHMYIHNDTCIERRRAYLVPKAYFGPIKHLRSSIVVKKIKIKLYITVIMPGSMCQRPEI